MAQVVEVLGAGVTAVVAREAAAMVLASREEVETA